MKYFEDIKEYLPYISDDIKGVSEEEIDEVEKKLNIKFPLAYKEYLQLMGSNSGEIHEYDRCNLDEIIDMQIEANEIFQRKHSLYPTNHSKLKSNELVFTTHQNYSFTYLIDIDKYENPPVWIYIKGDDVHEYKESETFTDYIYKCLEQKAIWNKNLWQKFKDNGIEIEIPSWMNKKTEINKKTNLFRLALDYLEKLFRSSQ